MSPVATSQGPLGGVWRVAKRGNVYTARPPLTPSDLESPNAGNRFDAPAGTFGTVYFGTTLQCCYGEILSRLRPQNQLADLVRVDWQERGFLAPGEVSAAWRHERVAVRARLTSTPSAFLDVEHLETRVVLEHELASVMDRLGITEIDVAEIRGRDRRLTREIAAWAHRQTTDAGEPRFAGIRYLSRLSTDWECWGIFANPPQAVEQLEQSPIQATDAALLEVARTFGLRVF